MRVQQPTTVSVLHFLTTMNMNTTTQRKEADLDIQLVVLVFVEERPPLSSLSRAHLTRTPAKHRFRTDGDRTRQACRNNQDDAAKTRQSKRIADRTQKARDNNKTQAQQSRLQSKQRHTDPSAILHSARTDQAGSAPRPSARPAVRCVRWPATRDEQSRLVEDEHNRRSAGNCKHTQNVDALLHKDTRQHENHEISTKQLTTN